MPKVGFIGGGQMAAALIVGITRSKYCVPQDVLVSDTNEESLKRLEAQVPGIQLFPNNNPAVAAQSDVLLLSVKPNVMPKILAEICSKVNPSRTLVISVAAGVTIASIQSALPAKTRVVRVMPNTPSLVGAGAAGFALGDSTLPGDEGVAAAILQSVGKAWRLEERLLDPVCGLSGSGPAYVFTVIEAMADGGVLAGLPRDVAVQLAAQTAFGAAKMVLEQPAGVAGRHTAQLRDGVTSPGGTTATALLELETAGMRAALIKAVMAATNKSVALGRAKL